LPPIPVTNFLTILGTHGTSIAWYSKTTGSDDPFDTGSQITYGYGDASISLTSGSFNAIIMPGKVEEVLIEPGFYLENYHSIFFKADDAPDFFDYVSFFGQLRLVLPSQRRSDFGRTIFKKMMVRVLIPSGSNQILPNYLSQVTP
jgi:hypothetical protein